MPHKVFTIEKLFGENVNQPERVSGHPTRVIGRLTRIGGIEEDYPLKQTPSTWQLVGYDWLGGVARSNAGSVNTSYSQRNTSRTNATSLKFEYYPGVATIFWRSPQRDEPVAAQYLKPDGTFGYIEGSCIVASATAEAWSGTGHTAFPGGSYLYVIMVHFVRGMYGMIPFGITKAVANNASTWRLRITVDNFGCPGSCETETRIYVALVSGYSVTCDYGTTGYDNGSWFYLGSITKAGHYHIERVFYREDVDDNPNSRPTFYVGMNKIYNVFSKGFTYSKSRTWHASQYEQWIDGVYAAGFQFRHICTGPPSTADIVIERFRCVEKSRVFFSDADYIGYSDAIEPQSIKFDDVIDTVVPSVRGIYAASSTSIYEAFGDFETLANTAVSLVPMVVGVDQNVLQNSAFSGDVAYFVKNNEIFKLGTGGVQRIGIPEHNEFPILAIAYDRYNERLIATTGEIPRRLIAFDATRNAWTTLVEDVPGWPDTLVVLYSAPLTYFVGDYNYERDITSGRLYAYFEKVDMGAPGLRKRVHTMRIPWEGNVLPTIRFRRHGSATWYPAVVRLRNGYVEARFPSVVDDSFDFEIDLTESGLGNHFYRLNPPIVITYQLREKAYAQE